MDPFLCGLVDSALAAFFQNNMSHIICESLCNNCTKLHQFSTDGFTSIVIGGSNFYIGHNICKQKLHKCQFLKKNVTVLSMNLSLFVPTLDITTVKNQEVRKTPDLY